jgi:anti-sigma regulatory factor (Ser/Thr protein kinase)
MPMAITAAETTPLITFTLPSTRYSVQIARFYVRAALDYHSLRSFAEDAQMVTSELVSNAIEHAGAASFSAGLLRLNSCGSIAVIVSDSSPFPPVKREPPAGTEHGRGLCIVGALSASWGWQRHQDAPGKAVYAILTAEA